MPKNKTCQAWDWMCQYDTSGNPSFDVKRAWVHSMADHMFTESKGVTPKEAAKVGSDMLLTTEEAKVGFDILAGVCKEAYKGKRNEGGVPTRVKAATNPFKY